MKKITILCVMAMLCLQFRAIAQEKVKGRVVDTQTNEALPGAVIKIPESNITLITDAKGEFELTLNKGSHVLQVKLLGYEQHEFIITVPKTEIVNIELHSKSSELKEVQIVNTGYQFIPKERATGSFVLIDSALLSTNITSSILSKIENTASGVLSDKNAGTSLGLNVRGRSTIFGNTDPLIVIDDFPFEGNINLINPDDIENITILKDAAAASIWGVRASNGVIVLTTKKGKQNQKVSVAYNNNISVREKPDLFASNTIGVQDYIELEERLFGLGAFNSAISVPRSFTSPVVEILNDRAKGLITEAQAKEAISMLKAKVDVRSEMSKYYYRPGLEMQNTLSIQGGGNQSKYYFSLGRQNQDENLRTNSNNRITLLMQNSYNLFKNIVELNTSINIAQGNNKYHNGLIFNNTFIKPYSNLKDEDGNNLSLPRYKKAWLDTIGSGRLLNWDWYPLEELANERHRKDARSYLLDFGLKIKPIKDFVINLKYQYGNGLSSDQDLFTTNSFYTRDLINQFSQINYNTGEVIRNIPFGDIIRYTDTEYNSHNLRTLLTYERSLGKDNFNILGGVEIKDFTSRTDNYTHYGYDNELGQIAIIDYVNAYRNFLTNGQSRISGSPTQNSLTDRYLSYFFNGLYTINNKYTFSVSGRKDESNLFGVDANKKGVPLWSLGFLWNIGNEKFFDINGFDDLKLRLTYGFNGNVDKSVSAYVTAQANSARNPYGLQYASILNPPNPELRWEKVATFNVGLDFSLLKNKIQGFLEFYHKNADDIIGNSPLPPSTGIVNFRGNSAQVMSRGVDLNLRTKILNTAFKWNVDFLFSYNKDKIVDYKVYTSVLGFKEGFPYNSIFSYKWAGLDNATGDPIGILNGVPSKDWGKINNMDSIGKNYVYSGSLAPLTYGNLRQNFFYKNFLLSVNLSYKLNYVFRRSSVDYSSLNTLSATHIDYLQRWLKPGDEVKTTVPSAIYPGNAARDLFYRNSEALVERGDHIRLSNIQFSYNHPKKIGFLKNCKFILTASNLGIAWRANNKKIDPEFLDSRLQSTYSISFSSQF